MIIIQVLVFLLGLIIVAGTLLSAIQTLVLPRGARDRLSRYVFLTIRFILEFLIRRKSSYLAKDRIMAFYAPISTIALLPVWLTSVQIGYMLMFWALGESSWYQAFRDSGSSLLTLGYASINQFPETFLEFTEATIGLMLVALIIAYLPSMYSAFSRREAAVTLLEVRAGSPPNAVEMLLRFNRIHGLEKLTHEWETWETWFADVEESHTSLSPLVFFRSPDPWHSWITAAGAILDTASLTLSSVDVANDPQAALCIRAGYLALQHIASFFNIPFNPDPIYPDEPISVSREEFEFALDQLAEGGVPLKPDRQQAWSDFAGWRVNYDRVLLALVDLTMAPESPWTGRSNSTTQ
ncbi:MAG: hypothetical protein PVF74_12620 [Anaerolineales bacterium]